MSKLVVDANTVIDWFHTSEESEAYFRYLEPLITEGGTQLVVPLHFDIEVCAHLVKKNRLHLARTMELPLATRDPGLISACKRWNVLHWTP